MLRRKLTAMILICEQIYKIFFKKVGRVCIWVIFISFFAQLFYFVFALGPSKRSSRIITLLSIKLQQMTKNIRFLESGRTLISYIIKIVQLVNY